VTGNAHFTSNISTASNVLITGDATATSKTTGALQVTGGVGVSGDIHATNVNFEGVEADNVTITDATNSINEDTGALRVQNGGAGIKLDLNVGGVTKVWDETDATTTTSGALQVLGGLGVVKSIHAADTTFESVTVTDTTISANTISGALQVAGGIGVANNVHVGNDIYIGSNLNVDTTTFHVDSVSNRIGIGKTNPDSTLDISGNTYTSGNVTVGTAAFHVDTIESNVGIGTTLPLYTFDVNGDINATRFLLAGVEAGLSPFARNGINISLPGPFENVRVGIGTDAPDANIHVTGNVYATNLECVNLIFDTVTTNATYSLDDVVTVSNLTSNTVQFTNTNTSLVTQGKVGVNTNTPTYTLDINGTANVESLLSTSNIGIKIDWSPEYELDINGGINCHSILTNSLTVAGGSLNIGSGLDITSNTITQSGVPAFTVTLTDGTITGGPVDIDYNNVIRDNTSSYSVSTGKYTAPYTGHYFFSAHGTYVGDLTIYDFTIDNVRQNINALCDSTGSSYYLQCNISAVLYLTAGQTVAVRQIEGGTFGTDNNSFCGFFIG
jgi:hypothetical protein